MRPSVQLSRAVAALAGACDHGRLCADDSDDFHLFEDEAGDASDPADAADRVNEALAEGRRPTIFMWQPSRFELVTGDRLPEWERGIREHVGVPTSNILQDDDGSACLTPTLPHECMDDCDYLAE